MIDADVVIDVFNGVIDCLSSLLSTDVGAWIGGCVIICFVFKIIKSFQNI